MKISYAEHALQRMKERGVSVTEIEAAFAHGKKDDAKEGRRMIEYMTKKGTLKVVYRILNIKSIEVISTYWI
ncbi:MAG: DUF4258 domain-containing protein [bacterium]|nr:DUF4258 domain-containing protein [bacterium]